ncbi:TRAF3-interacting protein 1-like [Iris pallida]|uniref:TRAF3-interacting protein 1-like n=1 Tax=Iris pallida TaxID=29817 RepID=A0AAX6E1I0_IRIPA|nr:TRAF3-interacting protein 1-like [Iris pallida]
MVDGKETGFWSIVELERVEVVVVVEEVVLTAGIICSAMSRCFPFPPPGYEKAARNGDDNEDLLKKEKHKEKKHKKEKRDKEKRESKERKDKDRSKDKNKEKKDRKEKHKDKTKDKDKNRTPEDTKTEIRPEICHEDQFGYNCKSEVQDSKFTEEFGRRIRDEERGAAADRSVGNFTTTTQGRLDGVGVSTALEKESGNRMVPDFAGRVQKRHDNLTLPIQKKTEEMGTGVATAKQRTLSGENVSDFSSTEPGKNHVTGRQTGNFTGSFQNGTEGRVTSNSLQKERSGSKYLANSLQKGRCAGNNITGRDVNNFMGSGQRTEGMLTANPMQKERAGSNNVPGWPVNNFICSTEKSGFTANSMLKERGASNNLVSNSPTGAAQRKNDRMVQQSQNLSSSTQKSTGGIGLTPKMEKERVKDSEISMHKETGASNNVVRNLVGAAERKDDRMGQQGGNPMTSIQRIAEGIGLARTMEKEAVKDNGTVPYTIATEQKNDWMGKSAEKPSEKKKEKKKKKSKEKKMKEGKGEEHKDGDRHEKKSKGKDKDRHKEKEKEEKIRDKSEHKYEEHDKREEIRTNDQVDDITKSKFPHAENAIFTAADRNEKKRKGIEINGFLHEIDERPNKLSKTTASSSCPVVENGRTLKLSHITSRPSLELDAINKTKAELVLGNKETKANGKAEANPPSVVLRPPVAVVEGQSGKVSSRPNHPDAKYLINVYSVPEMAEWPEYDDQGWLFLGKNPEPLKKLMDDAILAEVWAKGSQIESADVFALPFVVPF